MMRATSICLALTVALATPALAHTGAGETNSFASGTRRYRSHAGCPGGQPLARPVQIPRFGDQHPAELERERPARERIAHIVRGRSDGRLSDRHSRRRRRRLRHQRHDQRRHRRQGRHACYRMRIP